MAAAWPWEYRHWPAFLVLCALVVLTLQSSAFFAQAFFHVEHSDSNSNSNSNSNRNSNSNSNSNSNTNSNSNSEGFQDLLQEQWQHNCNRHLPPASCICPRQHNLLHLHPRCASQPLSFGHHETLKDGFFVEERAHATTSRPSSDKSSDHIIDTSTESTNHDEVQHEEAAEVVTGPAAGELQHGYEDHHSSSLTNQPASSPTIAGSTVVVHLQEADTTTQTHDPMSRVTDAVVENSHEFVPSDSLHLDIGSSSSSSSSSSTGITPSSLMPPTETGTQNTLQAKTTSISSAIASPPTVLHHTERYIPSYEQWRKQILEKKKPANANERKQRKRKPFQESSVDVAIGSEDELGFVFSNMDSGNSGGKSSDNRFQHLSDQLGNGPDLKQGIDQDKQWIKSEYSKDPKDRFNHASTTCAASVVKASKDATSIMAILNEGKDNYMLNTCSTKDKFFVVELCEEILVDTFVLGNYEFFSSTFKDFVASVNRYPPRDDGWSILGHFQARNTRDAQVFKPTVPQLATYIRFDFLSHYGNEYYCPITLLRVYGATALEQLKQEEEEEKRQAEEDKSQAEEEKSQVEEEKQLTELEKARQAAAAADDPDDVEETEVMDAAETGSTEGTKQHTSTHATNNGMAAGDPQPFGHHLETLQSKVESDLTVTYIDSVSHTGLLPAYSTLLPQDKEYGDHGMLVDDIHSAPDPSEADSLIVTHQDEPNLTEGSAYKDDSTVIHDPSTDTTLKSFEEIAIAFSDYSSADVLLPPASTSPASMQDDSDWGNADLEMITLSPKSRPTRPPAGPKPSSSGTSATAGGASSSTESSPHPSPSPQHSSQESVYKNIVNRLKVLELNSTLSYQYLEEQSNVYNEVLESSEQKINQLVNHLNEATRRLETLGRKYDQLAYSYRAHVEVDGEKRRQDFINLSSQVHLLGAQVMFQRQLFVVGGITLFSIVAFIAITRSTTMHYAIQQSPLGAKLRAISGQRNETRSSDITASVRIGSLESLSQFDQKSLMLHRSNEGRSDPLGQGNKLSLPMSLTSDPNHTAPPSFMDTREHPLMDSPFPDPDTSCQNDSAVDAILPGNDDLPISCSEESPIPHLLVGSSKVKSHSTSLHDQFMVSRTPYPTPKSFGPGRLFLHPSHNHSPQPPHLYSNDYRPSSPVFQGPSSVHDEGQLSDADVAYMSRDMGVGRKGSSSPGSVPTSPATRKNSTNYYNYMHPHHHHHSTTSRSLSPLRTENTASLAALARSEFGDPDSLQLSSGSNVNTDRLEASANETSQEFQNENNNTLDNTEMTTITIIRTPVMAARMEFEEDVGFVSDSVLDSASETSNRDVLQPSGAIGDWDRQHSPGEAISRHEDGEEDGHLDSQPIDEPVKTKPDVLAKDVVIERPRLTREGSFKPKRSSSHNILHSQEFTSSNHSKNHSASAILEPGVGLGFDIASDAGPPVQDMFSRLEPSLMSQPDMIEHGEGEVDDDGVQADDDGSAVPQNQGLTERRKKNKRYSQSEDQAVLRRRVSHGRQESVDKAAAEDRGQDGDDERSPQVSRRWGH